MRLLLDEHVDKGLAEQLRLRGYDVTAVTEVPTLRGTADAALLEWGAAERRVIVTYNVRHFMPQIAHRLTTERPLYGVVLISAHKFPEGKSNFGRVLRALEELLVAHPEEDALLNRYVWL